MLSEGDMIRVMTLAVVLAAGASTSVWAAQPSTPRPGNAARSNPYSRLFQPARPFTDLAIARPDRAPEAEPQNQCGKTMVERKEPRIQAPAPVPNDPSTRYTIRVVEPAVCK